MAALTEIIFDIATAPSRKSKMWKNTKISWAGLLKKLETPIRTGETAAEYFAMKKVERDKRKDQGGFVGGYLEGGIRKKGSVKHRQLVCLDVDNIQSGTDFPKLAEAALPNTAYIIYSTHSHRKEEPRYRIVIPLHRRISAEEYEPVARYLAGQIGIDCFDPTTYEPSRLMYWASAPQNGDYVFLHHEGNPCNADAVLGKYDDWHDASAWPTGRTETVARQRLVKKLGDPREKPGAIGMFCRAYTIPEAIAKFLPEVYIPCDIPNRYTYAQGSTTAGMIVYDDDLLCYSHHSTDPISGLDVNAFDLVRLNLYGEMDSDVEEGTPINKHPSFLAMCDLVNKDKKVRTILSESIANDFLNDNSLDAETVSTDWLTQLERTRQGKIVSTVSNFLLILENDPRLKGMAGLDHFSHRILLKRNLPWREMHGDDVWRDSDDAQLRNYISTTYEGLTGKSLIDDALVETVNRHAFHQVKDYWAGLVWDGKPRIATLLVDYLGATDNEYTREATKLFFKAAVARVFSPGIKFDICLFLPGPQGIGKSTILSRMGGKWFNDSVISMTDKDSLEQLQGSLIIELAEMQATKRAENDQIKAFISRQIDKFRAPYGRRTEEYPRQCVFAATTNDAVFLRDRTGGRRFLIVPCAGEGWKPLDEFTSEEAGQCWAELMGIYEQDPNIELKGILREMSQHMQEIHTEGAEKAGMVQEYLDTLLPEDWADMDLSERRHFLRGEDTLNRVGIVQRDRVCVMEIWCELFENSRTSLKNMDARELNTIMQHMPGWKSYGLFKKSGGMLRFGDYGLQRAYVRMPMGTSSKKISDGDDLI